MTLAEMAFVTHPKYTLCFDTEENCNKAVEALNDKRVPHEQHGNEVHFAKQCHFDVGRHTIHDAGQLVKESIDEDSKEAEKHALHVASNRQPNGDLTPAQKRLKDAIEFAKKRANEAVTSHEAALLSKQANDMSKVAKKNNSQITHAKAYTLHRMAAQHASLDDKVHHYKQMEIHKQMFAAAAQHESIQLTNEGNEMKELTPVQKRIRMVLESYKAKQDSIDEAFDGTHVIIEKPGHHLHGKKAAVFYHHADGSVNAQIRTGKGIKDNEIHNFTLQPHEYKTLNESDLGEAKVSAALQGTPWDLGTQSHDPHGAAKTTRKGEHGETITQVAGKSYGKDEDEDDDTDRPGFKRPGSEVKVKRGRGRPAGAKSGARTHGEDGGVKNQAIYGGREHSVLSPTPSRFSK